MTPPGDTIAWRLGAPAFRLRGSLGVDLRAAAAVACAAGRLHPSAAVALERFWALMDRWRDSVAAMTPEQLEAPGFGQYPNGPDPGEPFITVVWWTNLEFIHHMAEVALLRDLYRTRSRSPHKVSERPHRSNRPAWSRRSAP